jgi:hypothetical protein
VIDREGLSAGEVKSRRRRGLVWLNSPDEGVTDLSAYARGGEEAASRVSNPTAATGLVRGLIRRP